MLQAPTPCGTCGDRLSVAVIASAGEVVNLCDRCLDDLTDSNDFKDDG